MLIIMVKACYRVCDRTQRASAAPWPCDATHRRIDARWILSWSGSVTTAVGSVVSEGYPAVIVLELERREHFCPLSQFPSHRRAELPHFLRRGTARTCFHVELPPSPHQGDELLTGSGSTGGFGGGVEIGGGW
jgi:hypothetical protein